LRGGLPILGPTPEPKGGQQLEGVVERAEGVTMRPGADGTLRQASERADRLPPVPCLLESQRELGRDVRCPLAMRLDQALGHARCISARRAAGTRPYSSSR
jgi:hypothetical protein